MQKKKRKIHENYKNIITQYNKNKTNETKMGETKYVM